MPAKKTPTQFRDEMRELHPTLKLLSEYTNARTPIAVHCEKCGHIWMADPRNLVKGHGCPICGQKKAAASRTAKPTKALGRRLAEAKATFPDIVFPNDLKTTKETFEAHCTICGNRWTTSLSRILNTRGCPKCSRRKTSVAEQFLYESARLALPGHRVISQDHNLIGRELDIYVPGLKKAVEFGAWHWHENRTARDIRKEALCEAEGVELLTIYEHANTTGATLPKRCLCMEDQAKTLDELTELAKEVLAFLDPTLDVDALAIDWARVHATALERTDRERHLADFARAMTERHPTLEAISPYRRYHDPIEVRCSVCGHIWESTPRYLLSEGHGCPECARRLAAKHRTLTTSDFKAKLKALNPNLTLLGEYAGAKGHVKVRCDRCGLTWSIRADALLANPRCPSCAGTFVRKKNRIAPATKGPVASSDPDVEVVSPYEGDDRPMLCRCKRCGHTFERTPRNLRRYPHCPACHGQGHVRYTDATFKAKMAEVNPKITVIGTFVKQAEKLECACNVCGHQWMVTPNKLLQGRGCPKCASRTRAAKALAARRAKLQGDDQCPAN